MKPFSISKALLCLTFLFSFGTQLLSCKKISITQGENLQSSSALILQEDKGSDLSNCLAYSVTVSRSYNLALNQTTFTWTITNTNPGNGSAGTAKDLSHWDLQLCQRAAENILSVSNSLGVQVPANYQVDPSLSCNTSPLLKFDYGTSGSTATTYVAIFGGNFSVGTMTAYFKAGTNCCTNTVPGVSCDIAVGCTLSQGYWFANARHSWKGISVTVGGFQYTQAEGQALWALAPGGSGGNATGCFYQAAAIRLDNVGLPANVLADLAVIDNFLAPLGKLSAANIPTATNANAVAAAERISNYITEHHCE